jgi:hypothetical protein
MTLLGQRGNLTLALIAGHGPFKDLWHQPPAT